MPQPYSHSLTATHSDSGGTEIIHAVDMNGVASHVNQLEIDANAGGPLDLPGHVLSGHLSTGAVPFSVGPYPQDDSGWTRDLIGTGTPTLGIPRAPLLTTMAVNNQLHLPQSIGGLIESPPTSLQAQINATSSGGVCHVTTGYIYREAVTISNPITIICRGGVSLRGSDDWSSGGISGNTWSLSGGIYTSSLTVPAMATDATQGSPTNTYAQNHRETVFLDGIALQIANTASPTAGQFALDGSRHVLLGTNPAGRKVEVATRMTVITSVGNIALTIDGLDIRHVASSGTGQPTALNASTITTAALTLLNCMIGWCHGAGLNVGGLSASNLYVQNCIIHDCGTSGIAASSNTNAVYRGIIFFNNGLSVYGWDPSFGSGGIKEAGSTGGLIDSCVAFANTSVGLWYDVLVTRGVIRSSVCWDNPFDISYEVSSFGVLRDNVCFRTPNMPGGLSGQNIGMFVSNSRWVECYGNLLMHMPLNFKYLYAPTRTDSPPSGSTDTTHMGGVNFHDNTVIGRYHAADQSGFSDIAEQWADNGSGTYTNVTGNAGTNNQFGWPALINSGGSFLEVQQEADSRWWHDGGGGNLQITTLAAWQALQFSAASDKYMLDATRVAHLRRFGLIP